jgi:hypothetical protein
VVKIKSPAFWLWTPESMVGTRELELGLELDDKQH